MHVLLLVANFPWFYGAYTDQGWKLANGLVDLGHDVTWCTWMFHHPGYHDDHLAAAKAAGKRPPTPEEFVGEPWDRVRYFGLDKRERPAEGFRISDVNRIARELAFDGVISLSDVGRMVPDENARVRFASWFPLHFAKVDADFARALNVYSDIVALAPSANRALSLGLAKEVTVTTIPHAVEPPPSFTPVNDVAARRRARGMPEKAFVALIHCGNYENYNRKALDISFMAFAKFHKARSSPGGRELFLYVHAISVKRINDNFGNPQGGPDVGADVESIAEHSGLVKGSYVWDDAIHEIGAAFELMALADVLLMPSRVEGFGIPILEAQLLGTPAITADFLAMGDYTWYGEAVPILQTEYMVKGMVATPSVDGTAAALGRALDGAPGFRAADAARARAAIEATMSRATVAKAFEALLAKPLAPAWLARARPAPAKPAAVDGTWLPVAYEAEASAYLAAYDARLPSWALTYSEDYAVDETCVARAMNSIASEANHLGESDYTVLFGALDADGNEFPTQAHLDSNFLPPATPLVVPAWKLRKELATAKPGAAGNFQAAYQLFLQAKIKRRGDTSCVTARKSKQAEL